MKKGTITNLMLGTVALLGIGYAIKKYNIKKANKMLEVYISNHVKDDMYNERKYYTIGSTVLEDGEFVIKRK